LVSTHKYTNIYRKEEQLDTDPNVSDKFGWATTQTGKYLLIVQSQQAFRDNAIILHDRITIEEFCNYVYLKKQTWNPNQILKTGAIQGLHDDCVIATILALHAARMYPQTPKPKPRRGPKLTEDQAAQRKLFSAFAEKLKRRFGGKEKPNIA
jgi:hypothetical protein